MDAQNEIFIRELQTKRSIRSGRIVKAFLKIDRADFVPPEFRAVAYTDAPIPISSEVSTSQPSTVAFMLERLQPKLGQKVLEIGTGSGYLTALLANLVGMEGKVFSIEFDPELNKFAGDNLKKYKFGNIELIIGDGRKGLSKQAPFDIIVSSAEVRKAVPKVWREQLAVGGKLLTPIDGKLSMLIRISPTKFQKHDYHFFEFTLLK